MKIVKDSFSAYYYPSGALAGAAYIVYLKPKYERSITKHPRRKLRSILTTLEYHIYAANNKDAMMALGYVHAQDRLWQMELMRRIAPGRLSEIFW
jgi:penicillin amidase